MRVATTESVQMLRNRILVMISPPFWQLSSFVFFFEAAMVVVVPPKQLSKRVTRARAIILLKQMGQERPFLSGSWKK